jgi:hypothetical protein
MKNLWAKTRGIEAPYLTVCHAGWAWRVLKAYKGAAAEAKDGYSRWFCHVSSPMLPEGELGDVYVKDVVWAATEEGVINGLLEVIEQRKAQEARA